MKQLIGLITLFCLLSSMPLAYGQLGTNDLRVQVMAEDGPRELATIYLPDLGLGGVTDEAGVLLMEQLPQGEHQLEVSYVGYFSQSRTVKLTSGELVAIDVYMAPQVLEEVVVTGTMREIRRSDSPIPVDVITTSLLAKFSVKIV